MTELRKRRLSLIKFRAEVMRLDAHDAYSIVSSEIDDKKSDETEVADLVDIMDWSTD